MNTRSLTMAILLAATALAFVPTAQANTCSTLIYHPLTGNPAIQACTGDMGPHADTRLMDCTPIVSPLEICQESYCEGGSSGTCWDGRTIVRIGPGASNEVLGIWATCGGDPGQSYPDLASTFCAYGVTSAGNGAIVYLPNQDIGKPALGYYILSGTWNCVQTDTGL